MLHFPFWPWWRWYPFLLFTLFLSLFLVFWNLAVQDKSFEFLIVINLLFGLLFNRLFSDHLICYFFEGLSNKAHHFFGCFLDIFFFCFLDSFFIEIWHFVNDFEFKLLLFGIYTIKWDRCNLVNDFLKSLFFFQKTYN